jgi:hypothetical protein
MGTAISELNIAAPMKTGRRQQQPSTSPPVPLADDVEQHEREEDDARAEEHTADDVPATS